MVPSSGQTFRARVEGAQVGTHYRFQLKTPKGTVERTDPYCRHVVGLDCLVVDPHRYAWKTTSFSRPSLRNAVIYELHVGSFAVPAGATQGTFASTTAALPQLADLGVNVIQLMPVMDFGGNPNGWGYNPHLGLAPKPSYGRPDGLRALVDEAHRLGMAVWLDMVANHYDGSDRAPLYCFDGDCSQGSWGVYFFTQPPYAHTPWGPRFDFTKPQVKRLLLAAAEAWLVEYRGDGFRWDSVSNIRAVDGQGTVPGGREFLLEANALAKAHGATSTAEDLKGFGPLTDAPSAGGFGFDAQWDGFGYDSFRVLDGEDDARDMGLLERILSTSTYAKNLTTRVLFTENHDTVGNGGMRVPNRLDAAAPTGPSARKRSLLNALFMLTAPGIPLLFMGQEHLALGTFVDPPTALAPATGLGLKVRSFYRDLIALRRNLDGNSTGLSSSGIDILLRDDARKVIAYRRFGNEGEDVVVVANLRGVPAHNVDLRMPDSGPWRVRLSLDDMTYGGEGKDRVETAASAPGLLKVSLGAYSALILSR